MVVAEIRWLTWKVNWLWEGALGLPMNVKWLGRVRLWFTVEYEMVVGLENCIYCGAGSSVRGMVSVSMDCALVVTGRSTILCGAVRGRMLAFWRVTWPSEFSLDTSVAPYLSTHYLANPARCVPPELATLAQEGCPTTFHPYSLPLTQQIFICTPAMSILRSRKKPYERDTSPSFMSTQFESK